MQSSGNGLTIRSLKGKAGIVAALVILASKIQTCLWNSLGVVITGCVWSTTNASKKSILFDRFSDLAVADPLSLESSDLNAKEVYASFCVRSVFSELHNPETPADLRSL